jgi:hypothetical protein
MTFEQQVWRGNDTYDFPGGITHPEISKKGGKEK